MATECGKVAKDCSLDDNDRIGEGRGLSVIEASIVSCCSTYSVWTVPYLQGKQAI